MASRVGGWSRAPDDDYFRWYELHTLSEQHLLLIGDGIKRSGTRDSDAGQYGGTAFISWFPHNDSVTVTADNRVGRVQLFQAFAMHSDGSLIKIEDGFN